MLIKINTNISEEYNMLRMDDNNLTSEDILPEIPNDKCKKTINIWNM